MTFEEEFQEMKDKNDELKALRERNKGALAQIKDRMRKEFGVKSIEEGRARQKSLNEERQKLEAQYSKLKRRFDKEYKDALGA